jgi:hypothetical protein
MIAVFARSLWDLPKEEEEVWEQEEQIQEELEQDESMSEIEQRLEKKRDWLKK